MTGEVCTSRKPGHSLLTHAVKGPVLTLGPAVTSAVSRFGPSDRECHDREVFATAIVEEPVQRHAEHLGAGDLQLVGAPQIQDSSGVGVGVRQGARWPYFGVSARMRSSCMRTG